jgi:hypothetical protein
VQIFIITKVSVRPYVNLLIVYDSCIPPDTTTLQTFMSTASSPLFVIYLTLVNTPEIRLFNYIHLHPEQVITWSTPIADLSAEAKKCLLSDFEYTPNDSDRQWNEYMSQKAYKWALIDQKSPFRETRTRPSSFISKNQYQIRPKRRLPNADNGLNDTTPEIMDILTQVLYDFFSSSGKAGSPLLKGPKHMSSPPHENDSRDSSRDSNRSTLNHRASSTACKLEEDTPMGTDEYNSRVSLSPSSVHKDAPSSVLSWNDLTPASLEKSIHSKRPKRKLLFERGEGSKRQTMNPHDTEEDRKGVFMHYTMGSMTEPVHEPHASSFRSTSTKRPHEESSPPRSPKNRRLTSPQATKMGEQDNKR